MLRKLSACLTVATIILSVLTGCASGGETAKSEYPETWTYLKNTYGDYISIDEDGNFEWNFGDDAATKLLPEENRDTYMGYDFILHVADVENSTEIGYAARYIIINNLDYIDYGIRDKIPKLQVYLDKRWWTVETQPQPGSDIGIGITTSYVYTFLNSMLARGTEKYLPEGRYRLVLNLNPEYNAVLTAEFYNEPDEQSLSEASEYAQNMKELYPETWKTLRSIYGNYIRIDEDGDFAWNFTAGNDHKLLPEDEYSLYDGGALSLEYTGITYAYESVGRAAEFTLTNSTDKDIRISDTGDVLQIYLDEKWWSLATGSKTPICNNGLRVKPGTEITASPLLANTTLKPLPNGHYRLLIDLNPTYDSYLSVEFDCSE